MNISQFSLNYSYHGNVSKFEISNIPDEWAEELINVCVRRCLAARYIKAANAAYKRQWNEMAIG